MFRKRFSHRIASTLIILCIISATALPFISAGFADGDTIMLSSKDDLIQFSENCRLDTWSEGKSVYLESDIDMSGVDFEPIPVFGGYFDGGNHKISGLSFTKSGSNIGLFRYINPSGCVCNLVLSASYTPSGSKNYIGGIAGCNMGKISDCCFDGTVKGNYNIGGIAGINKNEGKILSCSTYGSVCGDKLVGGICGRNDGYISSCENKSTVNNEPVDSDSSITDIAENISDTIENFGENSDEALMPSNSDIGGICGYSSGIIQGCGNYSTIGYQHTGYNVGGIAGRQTGYILSCENSGNVFGRKDVGGICGQSEPYTILSSAKENADSLNDRLDELKNLVNSLRTSGNDSEISNQLKDISSSADSAKENAKVMLDSVSSFADDNVSVINAETAIISSSVDELETAFSDLKEATESISDSLKKIDSALNSISLEVPDLSKDISKVVNGIRDLSNAVGSLSDAANTVKETLSEFDKAIKIHDVTAARKTLSELSKALDSYSSAKNKALTALENLEKILKETEPNIRAIIEKIPEIIAEITELKTALSDEKNALFNIIKQLSVLASNTSVDFNGMLDALGNLEFAADEFRFTFKKMRSGMSNIASGLSASYNSLHKFIQDADKQITSASEELSESAKSLSAASDRLGDVSEDFEAAMNKLKEVKSVKFVKLGPDFNDAGDGLFNSLGDISLTLDKLNKSADALKEEYSDKLQRINECLNSVFTLISDEFSEAGQKLGDFKIEDYLCDVSDEDIATTKQGKIDSCVNYSEICGDKNVGGIAGAMAKEYAVDPEEDIERPSSLNFTYKSKSVIYYCVNNGKISSVKNYAGGIAGKMDIGTVYGCENYSSVESTNGSYAGGIVGCSASSVRKSSSKSNVSAKTNSGGIAGKGNLLSSCRSISTVSADEFKGQIAGEAKDLAFIDNCVFIDNKTGGIDSISYSNIATPVSYEYMKTIPDIPIRFLSFELRFKADGNTVDVIEAEYQKPTSLIKCPAVPTKDGCYGRWESFPSEYVTENMEINAEYYDYIKTLASKESNGTGKLSLGIAEGSFDDKAEFHVVSANDTPPVSPKLNENVVVYDTVLYNTNLNDSTKTNIRLLNENKMKTTVWEKNDNGWEKVDCKSRGRYICLSMRGTNTRYCILYQPKSVILTILTYAGIILGALAVVFLLILLIRKRKAKNIDK